MSCASKQPLAEGALLGEILDIYRYIKSFKPDKWKKKTINIKLLLVSSHDRWTQQ